MELEKERSLSQRVNLTEIKKQFDENGFIKIEGFLSTPELDSLQRELERYIKDVVPTLPSREMFYQDKHDKTTLIRLQRMMHHDGSFKSLASSAIFCGLVDTLLGMKCEEHDLVFFSKPPGARETPPHQDGKYFMHDQGLTLWLALEDVDEENGCIYYVPGSHKQGLLQHYKTDMIGFSQALVDYTSDMAFKEIPMCVKRGTLLGHHPLTVHRAGQNRSSDRPRPVLGLTYWSCDVHDDHEIMKKYKDYIDQLMKQLQAQGKLYDK